MCFQKQAIISTTSSFFLVRIVIVFISYPSTTICIVSSPIACYNTTTTLRRDTIELDTRYFTIYTCRGI